MTNKTVRSFHQKKSSNKVNPEEASKLLNTASYMYALGFKVIITEINNTRIVMSKSDQVSLD